MRTIKIFINAIPVFLKLSYYILRGSKDNKKLTDFGVKFRLFFEKAGGVYVKFGQILSLRKDFIPTEICNELRKLLDQVPPFESEVAVKIIEDELKCKIGDIFSNFDKQPFAAASLGQVHKGTLKINGEKVVIKVLRPNINLQVKEDVKIIKLVTKFADLIPFFRIKLSPLAKEFESWLSEEIDYLNEARNMKEFEEFETDTLPIFNVPSKINLPKVYTQYTTNKVIVMEFIDGISVNKLIEICGNKESNEYKELIESKKWDITDINRRINVMQIKTVFVDGFFNADPHPSNIIITDDKKVYYIDFGLVGKLDDRTRVIVFRFLRAMSMLDKYTAYETIEMLLDTSRIKNRDKFRNALFDMFDDLKRKKVSGGITYAETSTNSMLGFLQLVYKMNIQIPPNIGKAFRFILTSDSIQHALVPDASIEEATRDLLQASLAATYLEIKKSLNKENISKIIVKLINLFEKEIILD